MSEQKDWLQTELDALTSSPEDSPAKTCPLQETAPACPVSAAACGPSFSELSLKFDPVGQSLRMSLGLELSGLMQCSLTWQEQGTPLGRWWWVLSMPEPRTGDSGFGLLPTPQAYSHGDSNPPGTTPQDRMVRWGDPNGRMLPTPKASDGRPKGNGGDRKSPWLDQMAKGGMLSTPRCAEGMAAPLRNPENILDGSRLEDAIAMQQDESNGTGPQHLSPCFVEWMMGYPAGFTDVSD